jgi:YidC/Oxa1 family membrane protein insertase
MEKRLLLFFALTFLIVTVWWRIYPPAKPAVEETPPASETSSGPENLPEAPKTTEKKGEAPKPSQPEEGKPEEASGAPEAVAQEKRSAGREETVVVKTDLYRMEMTNRGARIKHWTLAKYQDREGAPYEMVAQHASEFLGVGPLDVRLEGEGLQGRLSDVLFEIESPREVRLAVGEEAEIAFAWADGSGLEVEKRLKLTGGSYEVAVEISVRESGREIGKGVLYGPGIGDEVREGRYVGVEKGVMAARGDVDLYTASQVEEGEGEGVDVTATGVASHYFAGLMLPRGEGLYGASFEKATVPKREGESKDREVITAVLDAPRSPARFTLYVGPKKLENLEALAPGMGRIIEFGSWMRAPALLLRMGLMKIDGVVGNYGWSIVLLTVAINVVLLPLKHYSFVSMRRMQKLSPQIQHIRDRYKKVKPTDPRYQHMNQEIMNLYKEHKVSPVSGCLPMLLMIPFFFAFYRLLMASIELRQAPFVFWISDLSQFDPYFVLPIMMGVTQVAIQRMTPQTSADPMQAKIMQFMPILFTFILAWAPSGLVLYWFSNNLVSMGQQTVTNRILKNREEKAEEEEKAAKKQRKSKSKGKGGKTA